MSSGPGEQINALLAQLQQAAAAVELTDLPLLAKMHGWCEQLVDTTGDPAASAPAELRLEITAAAKTLEQLILGEIENAQQELNTLTTRISALDQLWAGIENAPAPAAGNSEHSAPSAAASTPEEIQPCASSVAVPVVEASEPLPGGYASEPLLLAASELEYVKGFVDEAREHLEAIEVAVLEVERSPDHMDKVNDLFRPFHTIKGMAGFLNLRDINCLTHEVETLLDQGRKGQRQITAGLIDLVFDVVDILKVQINEVAAYLPQPHGGVIAQPPVAKMIDKLRRVAAGEEAVSERSGSPPLKTGEKLVAMGVTAPEVVDFALEKQKTTTPEKKTGEILMDLGAATARQVSQATRPAAAESAPKAGSSTVADQSIRIDTLKLDSLVDLVGELVVAQTLVAGHTLIGSDPKLIKDVSQVGKIVRDVQEMAMSMRMIPIGGTFQKMSRLVRDVSRKADKQVELILAGEDTELDKNVIQQIGDPLVHMIRNAVDHGIEGPEDRAAAGKEPVGRVYLSARHQAGNIVIEIRDDGRGLNPQKLTAKAIEKGLIEPSQELTDQQAYALIFAPGFSTAQVISDISGRGVGMDVVRRNIQELRGKIEIQSEIGVGTTFTISLPLTLAIIDGMVVRAGEERFIIPTIVIEQALRPTPNMITTVQQRGQMLSVRGRLIPLIQLGQVFDMDGYINPCEAMVVIAITENREVGIVVNELIGQQQVVIKTLGEKFQHLRGVSGGAILGDGRVGLILEVSGLENVFRSYYQPMLDHSGATDHQGTLASVSNYKAVLN
ncbi:MAG: hypothetical protein HJJLKODD_01293 [Phycisphaerae bacterium]|nr:hypothetical protein [Phycisphaerae bacterium]